MVVLLEVSAERDADERPAVCDQLHGRGETALDDREVAAGECPEEVVHVTGGVHAFGRFDRSRVDPRPADEQQLGFGKVAA